MPIEWSMRFALAVLCHGDQRRMKGSVRIGRGEQSEQLNGEKRSLGSGTCGMGVARTRGGVCAVCGYIRRERER